MLLGYIIIEINNIVLKYSDHSEEELTCLFSYKAIPRQQY